GRRAEPGPQPSARFRQAAQRPVLASLRMAGTLPADGGQPGRDGGGRAGPPRARDRRRREDRGMTILGLPTVPLRRAVAGLALCLAAIVAGSGAGEAAPALKEAPFFEEAVNSGR